MTVAQRNREFFCGLIVKIIIFGNLTPKQENALHKLYHDLQMKNSLEGYIHEKK